MSEEVPSPYLLASPSPSEQPIDLPRPEVRKAPPETALSVEAKRRGCEKTAGRKVKQ